MKGGVLAFDMATSTGWAYARPGATPAPTSLEIASGAKAGRHISGSFVNGAQRTDPVKKLADFKTNFIPLIELYQPKFIIYEAPILSFGRTKYDIAKFLMGLAILVDLYCLENNLDQPYDVTASKVRKYFAGSSPRKSKDAKALVEKRCIELGWSYENQDESDALAILDYSLGWLARRDMLPQPVAEEEIDF